MGNNVSHLAASQNMYYPRFAASVVMHEACLPLFLYRYNLDRVNLLK